MTAQTAVEAPRRPCPVCGTSVRSPRAVYCSRACQMVAFRRRHGHREMELELAVVIPPQPARDQIVYECPQCEQRYLGQQRCNDCNVFARRIGPGGACVHCGDLLTVEELLDSS